MDKPHLILAPLRGVTQLQFRTCIARHFPGFDEAYSPFLTTLAGNKIKRTHLADVLPEKNEALTLVPQIIGKSPADFKTLLTTLKDLGYKRCDLNAGCPWPMIVKRGRGSGLMKDADNLRAMLDAGVEIMGEGLSLKVRLGIDKPDLLEKRMEIINQYPLACLTVHARTAKQMYEGKTDPESFEKILAMAKMPVNYNGDIFTPEDLERFQKRFKGVSGWMVGRGAIRDPALPSKLRGEKLGDNYAALIDFAQDYAETVRSTLEGGPAPFLGRMKEFWSYFKEALPNGEEIWQRVRISKSFEEYDRATQCDAVRRSASQ